MSEAKGFGLEPPAKVLALTESGPVLTSTGARMLALKVVLMVATELKACARVT